MDLLLTESGNGGDLVKTRKDLCVIEGLENMVYLALFGGNVEASTPVERLESEQAFDWWGNTLFHKDTPGIQFNSLTELTLQQVSLTSAGRIVIENAVKQDLQFLKEFASVSVAVSIPETDKIIIGVMLQQPDNLEKKIYEYVWDATRAELNSTDCGCPKDDTAYAGGEGIGYWFVEEDFEIT